MFVFSVFRLLSRRCHKIFSIPQLFSCPSQNRTSSFPTSGSSARLSAWAYPCQSRCHYYHPLHGGSVSLSRSTNREDLRSAGISRFSAKPLRPTGPHHSRRGHFMPSFYIGHDTRVLPLRISPRAPCSSLAWLTANRCVARCCLRPRGVDGTLVINASVTWPAPDQRGSARSQNYQFSELCFRFRATPFTSPHSLIGCIAHAIQPYTTGRLTKPYPGRPAILADHSCSTGNHCQVTLIFSPSHLLTFYSPSSGLCRLFSDT